MPDETHRHEVRDDPDPTCFDIYETANGLRPIGNTVRRCILGNMRGSELTVPEMIGATGLTKSTISTHLSLLYKEQLVGYREDPEDRRRKLYFLTSRYVGMSCPGDEAAGRSVPRMCADALEERALPKALLRAFVAGLRASGLDLRPFLRDTGRQVGEAIAAQTGSGDYETWCHQAAALWQEHQLGTLEFTEDENGPMLTVQDCKLCCSATGSAPMCGVTAGMLEGMASGTLETAVKVERIDPNIATLHGASGPTRAGHDTEDRPGSAGCTCSFRISLPLAENFA